MYMYMYMYISFFGNFAYLLLLLNKVVLKPMKGKSMEMGTFFFHFSSALLD